MKIVDNVDELVDRIVAGQLVLQLSYTPERIIDRCLYAVDVDARQHIRAVWLKFGSVYPALGPGWYVKIKKGGGGK